MRLDEKVIDKLLSEIAGAIVGGRCIEHDADVYLAARAFLSEPEKPKEPPARGVEEILMGVGSTFFPDSPAGKDLREALRLYREERAAGKVGWRPLCSTHGKWDAGRESGCPKCVQELRVECNTLKAKIEGATDALGGFPYSNMPPKCPCAGCRAYRILRGEP